MASRTDLITAAEPNAEITDWPLALQELQTAFNALLAKLDSNHGAAADHVATLAVTRLMTAKV